MRKFDVIIIGAGAAGLMAALQLKRENPNIAAVILEKALRPGKKLLATGGGRCNIANRRAGKAYYFTASGHNPAFVQPAFAAYPVADNLAFFANLGLLTKEEEDGKIYPMGDQAAAVLDVLRLQAAANGVSIFTETEVTALAPGWHITTTQGSFAARAIILTPGGVASPQLGTAGDFAQLMAPLGHKTTRLYPALTQLKCQSNFHKALQGVKFTGKATLWQKNTRLAEAAGEVLFTSYGLSGPPILQLSRLAAMNYPQPPQPEITARLDLLPAFTIEEIRADLARRRALPFTLEDTLSGLLNKRLGQQLFKLSTSKKLSAAASSLTDAEINTLAANIKSLTLTVSGVCGWREAQVMAGGLSLDQFDPKTLGSRLAPGLFAAGEVLDICGSCGGYNLSWAWSSGRLAAHSAALYLKEGENA